MICSKCGGEVVWMGPFSELTHTECKQCGAQNSQVLEHQDTDGGCVEGHEQKRIVMGALFEADHLATCAEKLLAALNRKAAAIERCEVADMGDIGAPSRAALELEQAEAEVSEYWRAVRNATYEYRGRAERARAALTLTLN